jgi:hypothetical protein
MAAVDDFTRHLLERVTRGEVYSLAVELAGLFLDDAPSQYPREALARHLVALASNVHGSFNWATDSFDLIEELRARSGQEPRRVASETTVRRHLRELAPREVEDLVNGVLRRLFAVSVARGELQGGYDLVLDETTFPYYGLGRNQATQAPKETERGPRERERLRTQASRQAMPVPPDKFHATRKGFPYHVLAARFTASRHTVALAYVRRRPGVAESTEAAVGALLPATAGLPAPNWILMDKWYTSADTVRLLQESFKANGWERTRFLLPVQRRPGDIPRALPKNQAPPKPGVKERRKPRQKWGPTRSLGAVAVEAFGSAVPVTVGPEGERFALIRDWQVSASDERARANLFLYYHPHRTGAGEWRMDWEAPRGWIGFLTNAEPTPETAYAIAQAYGHRWGIEILHKRDHGFMGLSKSQKMHPRDITYGLGLILGALENAHRTQVLQERAMRAQMGQTRGRRARRRVVRTHEVLGDLDRQAHGLEPARRQARSLGAKGASRL